MGPITRDMTKERPAARGGRLRSILLGTVFSSAALVAPQAMAQQLYFNADGTRTTDLTAAAATWAALPSFVANPALAGLNVQYAAAMGIDGSGVKLGLVDTSVDVAHPDLVNSRIHPLTTTGVYTKNGVFNTSVAGRPFTLSASDLGLNVYSGDIHGTAMSGFIAATGAPGTDPNGKPWTRGVAPGSDLYVARSIGQFFPPTLTGVDGAVMGAAYDALIAAGARAVNGEWQITQVAGSGFAGVAAQYNADPNNGALLGMRRAAASGAVVLMPGGNQNGETVGVGAALPNFVTGIEASWLAIVATDKPSGNLAAYSDVCGPSKWWCVTSTAYGNAPSYTTQNGTLIPSATNPITSITYTSGGNGGTSEASADALASMGLVLARFPYMTSQQARDVLLTTASPVDGQTGVNTLNGFGLINLKGAMQGPGQFLGAFQANLPTGTADTWNNDISEAAIVQRQQEASQLQQQGSSAGQQAALTRAKQLISNLQAVIAGASTLSTILPALYAARADPIASSVVGAFQPYITGYGIYQGLGFPDATIWNIYKNAINNASNALTNADYTQGMASYVAGVQAQISTSQAWLAGFGNGPVAGSLVKSGGGTLTLTGTNAFSGGVTMAGGTLSVSRDANLGALSGGLTFNGGILQITGTSFASTARSITWGNAGGGFDIAAPANTFTVSQALSGPGGLAKLGAGNLALAGVNTFTGPTSIAAGTLEARGGQAIGDLSAVTVAAGATFALRDSETIGSLAGNGAVALGTASLTAGGNNTSTLFAGILSGAGGLTKAGIGTLTLTGTNTYAGGTTIAGGTLQIGNGGTAGSIAGNVLDNGTLAFNRSDAVTFAGIISGAGSLSQIGPGTLTLTGTNTYAGGTTIAGGTLQIGNGGTAGSIVGNVLDNGTLAFNRSDAVTFAGAISGTGNLSQVGAGTLTLTGASSHTGLTTVAAGGLALTSTARLVSPVVTLAGATLTNAGALTGGVVNAGTATTSGLIAGGVTNTGTFTASAGQVNGAIRNQAGRFSVTGSVTSDATFANAAAGTLSVSGSYSLAGLLTNAGTLAVADGGRLVAGSIDNAGVLTVAASASVVDALNNTGFVNNAGSYTADATNAAGATLINGGTFTTVSQPFANSGTLVTTGALSGGLNNSGTVQAAGQLNGAVSNTGLIQLTGTTTGIARLTNDGAFDLGQTALTVGSLAGSTASATLGNGRLTVGTDDSSTSYTGRIIDGGSPTSLTKVGAGVLTLAGDSAFTGPLTVLGGSLSVTGTLAGTPVSVGAGTILSGQATFASLTLGAGSTIAPGAGPGQIGQISVVGNLAFAPGSIYRVDATADGRSDRLAVGGTASLTGGAVQAVADTGQYAPRTRYTILTARGGLSGQFSGVTSNFAFLTPFLGYDANDVYLTLARNDLDFAAVARTRNQLGAAAAVQAGGVGSALYDAVATLSAPQARVAFAALSGDSHASLVSTAFATAGLLRETVLDRLRWEGAARPDGLDYGTLPATYTADRPGQTTPPSSLHARVFDPRVFTLWGQGFGSTGRAESDGNAAAVSRTTGGFVFGADARLDEGVQLGAVGGYRSTSFAAPGSAGSGVVDGAFGGVYGSYRLGPVGVRFGALAADDGVSLRRLVLFPGFSGTPSARTGGTTIQGFGEAGYRIALGARPGAADLDGPAGMIEPFVGGAVVAVRRDRFTEQGGAAALSGAAREDMIPAATLGIRGQVTVDLGLGVRVVAHGLVGYRHAFGDVTPITRETILGTGASFASAGLPIDRDALVSEVGLSTLIAPNAVLGVSYTGQVGQRASDNTAKGSLSLRF